MNVDTRPDSPASERGIAELLSAARQAHQARDRGRAADLMALALARHERTGEPVPATLHQELGILLYELERFEQAIEWLRKGIAKRPKAATMINALGASLRRLGREDEAAEAFDAAMKLDKTNPAPLLNKSRILIDRQDIPAALALLTRALKMNAKLPDGQLLMGLAYRARGDFDQALRRIDLSLQLDPRASTTWTEKITTLRGVSRIDEAIATADQAIAKLGEQVNLVEAKANTLSQAGRVEEAIDWIAGLLAGNPHRAWLHMLMARLVTAMDRERANTHFRQALRLGPNDPAALIELAYNLDMTRGPHEARNINESYELAKRFIQIGRRTTGQTRRAHSIVHRSADYDAAEALGTFEDLGQRWAKAGQLAAMHLHLAQARLPRHRRLLVEWHRLAARPMAIQAAKAPLAPRAPAIRRAKIRIGLMSSDLRDHPVTYFTLPIIEGYDHARFELYCYSWSSFQPDKVHQFVAGAVDKFHHVPIIGGRAAAELIAGDHLDILFELGGSTAMNKIEVMAWKPAPRQASWLGYPHSIGLEQIDRILVDPFLNPPDPALLVEQPFMLGHSWVVLGRLGFRDDHVIEPGTPEERRGYLSFGTANNPYKYSRDVIGAWARIMKRVEGSRFVFVRPECGAESFRGNIRRHFEANGVDPGRIEFVAIRGKHMPHYNAIDIALDTFPHVGGTTTCESLWMGVPTVTLIGEAFFERMSYSNVTNAGLPELAAKDLAGYVDIAVKLAGDASRRAELRRTMRERIRGHPLGQPRVFVRDFMEAATRWMDEAP